MTRKKLEEFAAEDSAARFAENQEIHAKLNAVRASYGSLKAEHARQAQELEALRRIVDEAAVLKPAPGWLTKPKATKDHRGKLVALLADVHAGEVVRAEEMGGANAFNLDICDARLRRFFGKTIQLARDHLGGVSYDGIVLALGGDLVSGDIHDELRETNELSVLDTALWLAPRLVSGIEMLAEEFGKVHIVSVPGNHGRDSLKPRHKGRSAHNADTHVAKMAAYFYGRTNPSGSVTFDIPEAFDADFEVYGYRFSLEHGDNMRFAGTSEIGALGPVKRGAMRKARARLEEGRPFQTLMLGHFHQLVYAPSQGFIMGGTLKGFDEYAKSWALKPEPAQQMLFVVTPEHGPTVHAPIIVVDRDAEGW